MDVVDRGNPMEDWEETELRLEYAIHGKFKRRERDRNGVHGTWWVAYNKLLDTFNEDQMDAMIDEFEKTELAETRRQERERRKRGE